MNILEEFYYGSINPSEKFFDRKSDYARFVNIVSENEEKLRSYFNSIPSLKEEQHLFSQLMNAQTEIKGTETIECFIEGWKLGAKFMLDTFLIPRYSPFYSSFDEQN